MNYESNYNYLNIENRVLQTIVFLIIFILWVYMFYKVIQKRKELFKDFKSVFKFILLITIVCTSILPFTSSDIFYYMGVARIDGYYLQNPYAVSIKTFCFSEENFKYLETDTMLRKGFENIWSSQIQAYGATWSIIGKLIGILSLGKIDIGILMLKILCVIAHLANCYLIYKLSNRKLFVLLYGLNPVILLEEIANCHNDIFVITFTLLAFYFCIKKKNASLSVLFLAIATSIKYFTILFLPIIVLYLCQNKDIKHRIFSCLKYGIMFVIVVAFTYVPYASTTYILDGIKLQETKASKSFWILFVTNNPNRFIHFKIAWGILIGIFTILYVSYCFYLLFKKNISFRKEMQNILFFLIFFIFCLITNFQTWYTLWLVPILIWQKAKNIKLIMQILLSAQLSYAIYFSIELKFLSYDLVYYITFILCLFIMYQWKQEILKIDKQFFISKFQRFKLSELKKETVFYKE
jgi:hypothetical protein